MSNFIREKRQNVGYRYSNSFEKYEILIRRSHIENISCLYTSVDALEN